MLRNTRRRAVVALAGATLAPAVMAAPAQGATVTTTQQRNDDVTVQETMREAILRWAYNELNNESGHNQEVPLGSNCNYYSGAVSNTGSPACNVNWERQAWCADFAKYVWKNSGVKDLNQINSLAVSFRSYGRNHGTWVAGVSGIQPGDAVVYDGPNANDEHVGIVVIADGWNSMIIDGNWNNRVSKHKLTDPAYYQGYTRPVG